MGLTTSHRRTLTRKAADYSLEVEDVLRVATKGDVTDAVFLRSLKEQHGWSDTGREGDTLVVPFGRWAETVCRFWEESYTGLVRLAGESMRSAEFCIGLLVTLRTPESVSALLAIGGPVVERPASDTELAARLASGFNLILSFKGGPAVTPSVERQVREFLHRLLAADLTEVQRAVTVCALRGVGDSESLRVIAALPPFVGNWIGLERSAAAQIKKRLRQGT